MKGMLAPKFREVVQGHAEVRQIFKVFGCGHHRRLLRQERED